MNNRNESLQKAFYREKHFKLIASLLVDVVGILTYVVPALGEIGDGIWAPISGLLIYALFPKRKMFALGGMIEELIPITDMIPTATMTWMNWYLSDEDKAKRLFIEKKKRDEDIFGEMK